MIEEELRLCHKVSVEKPFEQNLGVPLRKLPHNWPIKPFLQRRIAPREDTYEYIDGGFRPSSEKILKLLGSHELYLTPNSTIREILQNSFDAVRERIAYERLSLGLDPAELGNRHKVTLSLTKENGDYLLVCHDDGAGMSKAIIRDHFLVSGASERPDLRRLSRQCRAAGFDLERTGQFGIGVLSYFLLGHSLSVHTRRLVEDSEDSEEGWHFDTNGIGSFGELRRSRRHAIGTTVTLRLRPELVGERERWWKELVDYVRETVIRLPCGFEVSSDLAGCETTISRGFGWLRTKTDLNRLAIAGMDSEIEDVAKHIGSAGATGRIDMNRGKFVERLKDTSRDAHERLQWHTSEDIKIEGVGICRIHVPVFHLEGGPSPLYMKTSHADERIKISPMRTQFSGGRNEVVATGTDSLTVLSWKGMSVHRKTASRQGSHTTQFAGSVGPHHHTIVEIDCFDREFGTLSLNREWIDLGRDADAWAVYRLVASHIEEAHVKVAQMYPNSPFSVLHYVLARQPAPAESIRSWLRFVSESDGHYWEPIDLPAISRTKVVPHTRLVIAGETVKEFSNVSFFLADGGWEQFWPFPPTRVVVLLSNEGGRYLVPIWDAFVESQRKPVDARGCKFPDGWDDVIGAMAPVLGQVWNSGISIVQELAGEAQEWLRKLKSDTAGLRAEMLESLAADRDRAIAFLFDTIRSREPQRWLDLIEESPTLMRQIWDDTVGAERRLVNIVQELKDDRVMTKCYVYTRDGCDESSELDKLPLPEDWVIRVE